MVFENEQLRIKQRRMNSSNVFFVVIISVLVVTDFNNFGIMLYAVILSSATHRKLFSG